MPMLSLIVNHDSCLGHCKKFYEGLRFSYGLETGQRGKDQALNSSAGVMRLQIPQDFKNGEIWSETVT
jgi:hypothetical protein